MSENKKVVKVSVRNRENGSPQNNRSIDSLEHCNNSAIPDSSKQHVVNKSNGARGNSSFSYKLLSIVLGVALFGTIAALLYSLNNDRSPDDSSEIETTTSFSFKSVQSDSLEDATPDDAQNGTFSFYNLEEYSNDAGDCILLKPKKVDLDNGFVYFEGVLADNSLSSNTLGESISNGFIKTFRDFHPHDWSYQVTQGPYAYRIINDSGIAYAAYDSFVITKTENLGEKCLYITAEDSDRSYNPEVHFVTAKYINWESGNVIESEGKYLIQYSVY